MWAIALLMGLMSPTDIVSSHVGCLLMGLWSPTFHVSSFERYRTVYGFEFTGGFVTSYVGYLIVDGFVVTNISCVKLCGLSHCLQV